MDVLRATAQTRFPMVVEQLANSGLCSPPPTFSFPSSIPLLPLPGTIPHRAAGNPPVCWKASFTGTQQPFQRDMWFSSEWIHQASQSFRRLLNDYWPVWGRKYFDRKNVSSLTAQDVEAWIRGHFSGVEQSNWTGACLPILTKWTRVKQHVFYPNNYHV